MTTLAPPRTPSLLALCLLAAAPLLPASRAAAVEVGAPVTNVELRDASDHPATIPDLGAKVIALFYTDADEKDMNDPLADAIKARKLDEQRYRGLGVVNLADSKAPNFLIRKAVRDKIAKYKSTILTDPDRRLAKAWGLGDCNNTSVVVVIGTDGKVAWAGRGPIRGDEIGKVVELIARLVSAASP
ncbi:MAG TPA: YtfJ family protein [Anaeromyxobacteraceae bacterium]|nr:YtfJ family protein [Anaeromyxobacteraceae bacterium]